MTKTKVEAAQEKYRVTLYRTLERLLADAEKQARAGKPALLRVLTRAAGRVRNPAATTDTNDAPWSQEEITRELAVMFTGRHETRAATRDAHAGTEEMPDAGDHKNSG